MADERRTGYRYADLYVGMAFRSPGRTITDADLVGFAGLTGDFSELHTSEVYAKKSQFGRRVAHGMLGLAYAHGLMWARTGELRETAIGTGAEDGTGIICQKTGEQDSEPTPGEELQRLRCWIRIDH